MKSALVYVTGTLRAGLEQTIEAHKAYVTEQNKNGTLTLSVILLLQYSGRNDGWKFLANALIPRATEVHVLSVPDPENQLIRPVKRDIEIANKCNTTVKFIDATKYLSHTAAEPTK